MHNNAEIWPNILPVLGKCKVWWHQQLYWFARAQVILANALKRLQAIQL